MPRQEGKAFRLFHKEHGGQVAMTDADLAIFRDRTGDTESLQPLTQRAGNFYSFGLSLFQCYS